MIKWISDPESRILSWRAYRSKLDEMTLEDAIISLDSVWKNCPKVRYNTIPSFDAASWPSPWELMNQSVYCELAQTLGIFYTLALTRHKDNNIEILDCSRNLTVGYRIVINGTYFIDSFDGSITNNDQVEPSQRYKISDKVILDRIR
jgi:hypothetical protein